MLNSSNKISFKDRLNILWVLMSKKLKFQFIQLLILVVLGGFAEVVSLGAVIPFLAIIINPSEAADISLVSWAIDFFKLDIVNGNYGQLMIIFSIIVIFATVIRYLLIYVTFKFNYGLGHEIGVGIYKKALFEPYSNHISRNKSEVIGGLNKLELFIWMALTSLNAISSLLLAVFITITLLIISPVLTSLILFGLAAIYTIFYFISKKKLVTNSNEISVKSIKRIQSVNEGLSSIRDIILGNKQNFFLRRFKKFDQEFRSAQVSNELIAPAPRHLIEVSCILFIVFYVNFSINSQGNASTIIPTIGVLVVGLQRLIPLGQHIFHGWTKYKGEKEAFNDVIGLISENLKNIDPESTNIAFEKQIEFKDVSFRYQENQSCIIQNINFTINKGSRIGIIGGTGSGKSTLVDLLVALLNPTKGRVLIDNTPLLNKYQRSWRDKIAYVSQEIYLLDNTFLANVAFGEKDKSINVDRVIWACRHAQISDFIENSQNSYSTIIGENGISLSGGQIQRIAIARALYKSSSILVFDEATSALDNETEKSVVSAIELLGPEITTITIAHRLSTVANCDWIYKLNKGRIESQGNPKTML
jgi:ATP-binding cassette, subfamily B, bacterial PglK